ncbi:MAG: efflux RND transporter periplasmic adaptor subunit [Mariprofundaceae bacterium]
MTMQASNTRFIAGILAALALGAGLGWMLAGNMSQQPYADANTAKAGDDGPCAGGKPPLFWRNPMNPAITSPTFQKDEMGMDYLPVCAEEAAGGGSAPAGTVTIDPTVVQRMGVRVARAEMREAATELTTMGRVTWDESRIVRLHPKVEGWVEHLFVSRTGERVKKDAMLLAMYSPRLVSTEEEYLLALANHDRLATSSIADVRQGAQRLLDASLARLRFFDVPEHQIRELTKTRKIIKNLHIHAPAGGVVTRIGVREGGHVTPATELFAIADPSRMWLLADLYESEMAGVREGDAVRVRIPALPGREFSGRIDYIYPWLEGKTRTNKARIVLANPDGVLKAGMYGTVTILADRRRRGVFVPREAVLHTGKRARVFVRVAEGRFEPREVETGAHLGDWIEIRRGVQAGEVVVTSGQFLIDSESSIREAAARMMTPKEPEAPAPEDMDMSDMDMDGMNINGDGARP